MKHACYVSLGVGLVLMLLLVRTLADQGTDR